MKEIELNLIRSFDIYIRTVFPMDLQSHQAFGTYRSLFSIVVAFVDHCDSDVLFVMTVNLDSVPLLLQLVLLLSVMFGVVLY